LVGIIAALSKCFGIIVDGDKPENLRVKLLSLFLLIGVVGLAVAQESSQDLPPFCWISAAVWWETRELGDRSRCISSIGTTDPGALPEASERDVGR